VTDAEMDALANADTAPPRTLTDEQMDAAGAPSAAPAEEKPLLTRVKEHVVGRVKEAVAHPLQEAKREVGELGTYAGNAVDAATFGYYRRARNALEGVIDPEGAARLQEAEDATNAEHPFVAGVSRGIGYFTPGGLPELAARSAGAGVRALTSAAPAAVRTVLAARPVEAALTGGLASGATTLGEDIAAGAPLDWQTARRALESAGTGALLSGGIGAAGAGRDIIADKVAKSRGAEARRLIESAGGTVSLTSPGKGGVIERELANVPANSKGEGAAAKIASKKVLEKIAADHRAETSEPYKVMKAQIDNSPAGQAQRDVSPIVAKMQDATFDLDTAPVVRSQLEGELKVLEKFRDPQSGAVTLSERQLNGLRRGLMRSAKIGMTDAPGEKEAPLRAAAFEAKRMVDEGPYQALNKFYAEGAKKLETQRTQLGLKRKPSSDAAVDTRKLKLSLLREGANSQTAGGDSELGAFRAANPDYAATLDLPELARARSDLAFRLMPHHGGLFTRLAGAGLGPGAAALALATGHGLHGIAPAAGILALQNATPIAGRVLYPLTRFRGAPVTPETAAQLSTAADLRRRRRALGTP
jgi:hypothetical protein